MALLGRDRSGATSSTGGNAVDPKQESGALTHPPPPILGLGEGDDIGVHCHLQDTHQNNVCFHIPGIHRPNVNQWIKYGASF